MYQGHSAAAPGLQNHSVGTTYPAIVVGYGDGSFGVDLGANRMVGLAHDTACQIAEEVGQVVSKQGWQAGVIRFHRLNVYAVANT